MQCSVYLYSQNKDGLGRPRRGSWVLISSGLDILATSEMKQHTGDYFFFSWKIFPIKINKSREREGEKENEKGVRPRTQILWEEMQVS